MTAFVSKKFIERRSYSALFDPAPTEKRMPRWHRREKISPRKAATLSENVQPMRNPTLSDKPIPWYKKRKNKVDASRPSS